MSGNLLITGATGLVGRYTIISLMNYTRKELKLPYERMVYLVRNINKTMPNIPFAVGLRGDITDFDFLERIISHYSISHILHFAAQSIVSVSQKNPRATFLSNVIGTLNILELARKYDVKWLLSMSTDKVYGNQKKVGLQKLYNYQPTEIYSASKVSVSILNEIYADTYGIKILEPRCCNLFGYDIQFSRLIPQTIVRCINNESPRIYRNKEGKTGKRQYLYVENATDHFVKAYLNNTRGIQNISIGKARSTEGVVFDILKYFPDLKPEYVEADFIEIEEQSIEPHFSFKMTQSYKKGLENTIESYKSNFANSLVIK